jgi:hypothetical protein
MRRYLRVASAALLAGCAQGGGCTPIGDNWFPGATILLLGISTFCLGKITWDVRNFMVDWRRTNRQDRRDERRADRPWNEPKDPPAPTTQPS